MMYNTIVINNIIIHGKPIYIALLIRLFLVSSFIYLSDPYSLSSSSMIFIPNGGFRFSKLALISIIADPESS